MPLKPSKNIIIILSGFNFGKQPSIFKVKKTRQTEAITNRKKAAEYGSILFAINFPATNVPPQKKAVNISLI